MCRCIATWDVDSEVDGTHNKSPITCDEVIGALAECIAGLSDRTEPMAVFRLAKENPAVYEIYRAHLAKRAEKTPA